MKRVLYFGGGLLTLLIGYFLIAINRPVTCHFLVDEGLRIHTIKREPFFEYFPLNGTMERDTISKTHSVHAPVDELYLTRVNIGMKACIWTTDREYLLTITHVNPAVTKGRFDVDLKFDADIPPIVLSNSQLRMRVKLSGTSNEILLPMGRFYLYTQGTWVFVVEGNRVMRRNVRLGRRMSGSGFEVLAGLKPGDRVITSSYEKFKEKQSFEVSEIETTEGI